LDKKKYKTFNKMKPMLNRTFFVVGKDGLLIEDVYTGSVFGFNIVSGNTVRNLQEDEVDYFCEFPFEIIKEKGE